jgi:hypothetical protein
MYKLTTQQAQSLFGVEIQSGWYFNPIKDINGDWFISEQEIQASYIDWLKHLEQAEFIPPEITDIPI